MEWKLLESNEYIDLKETLFSGQVFHFKQTGVGEYAGVISKILVVLRQEDRYIFYLDNHPNTKAVIEDFFNLGVKIDLDMKKHGLRFVSNDFFSTVFSFICSSNNNIKRISKMVNYLYSKGRQVDIVKYAPEWTSNAGVSSISQAYKTMFYEFPAIESLIDIEDELVKNKFGYRAKYICNAAKFLHTNQLRWCELSYFEARETLMKIKGVGRKIADCICLISLRHFHVVPIDTHIFKHSLELFDLQIKLLNAKSYEAIQEKWTERYGKYAGIAQLYAFKQRVDLKSGRESFK